MKIKDNYVLQTMADEYIVVPVGEEADRVHGIIKLNETGAFLWKRMAGEKTSSEELEGILMAEYPVDGNQARKDVAVFIEQLINIGCIDY